MENLNGNNKHERHHFTVDEVVFEVLHTTVTDQTEDLKALLVNAMQNFLRPSGYSPEKESNEKPPADSNWRDRLRPPTLESRIISFSSQTQIAGSARFSLIPVELIGHPDGDLTPDDVLNVLNDAYTELGDGFIVANDNDNDDDNDDEKDDDKKGGPEKLHVEKGEDKNGRDKRIRFRSFPLVEDGTIRLKSISPDWLASDLHHGGPTGGPGSMPASKPAPVETERRFQVRGKATLESLANYRKQLAQIAILDTALELDKFPEHLRAIFSVNPGLEVRLYPDQNELNQLFSYTPLPHHYEMPDHGTFIASIIRAIAPQSKIYLHQILNLFGVGTLVSTAQGVLDAVNQRENSSTPLILNCSFMLDRDLPDLDADMKKKIQKLYEPGIKDLLEISILDVFYWAINDSPNVVVVASAGNDAFPGNRPVARCPAAFDGVVSVAALPKDHPKSNGKYKPSSFSDKAHSKPNVDEADSFATFGGELVSGTLSPFEGVLGVYIGKIPTQNPADGTFLQPGHPNPTGWAEWSGTSFAAPIITGLLAAPESDLIIGPPEPGPYKTTDDENAILVEQVFVQQVLLAQQGQIPS